MSAYVGPCISAQAFEVGDEVAAQFPEASVVRRPEWPRPHVDLGVDLSRQLAEARIRDVELAGDCTVGGVDRFYSYRAENGKTGRMVGFIGLRAEARVGGFRSRQRRRVSWFHNRRGSETLPHMNAPC